MAFKPDINWTDDCQGKKDYDGRVVLVSSRYWPEAYSKNVDTCSAESTIYFAHANGEIMLATHAFEGATQAATQVQVEAWVQEQFDKIATALSAVFEVDLGT